MEKQFDDEPAGQGEQTAAQKMLFSFMLHGVFSPEISAALGCDEDDVLGWIGGGTCPEEMWSALCMVFNNAIEVAKDMRAESAQQLLCPIYNSEQELLAANKYWPAMSGRAHLVHGLVTKLSCSIALRNGVDAALVADKAYWEPIWVGRSPHLRSLFSDSERNLVRRGRKKARSQTGHAEKAKVNTHRASRGA